MSLTDSYNVKNFKLFYVMSELMPNGVTVSVLGPVWYMCLKTENCCLKIFMEIRVGEKVY